MIEPRSAYPSGSIAIFRYDIPSFPDVVSGVPSGDFLHSAVRGIIGIRRGGSAVDLHDSTFSVVTEAVDCVECGVASRIVGTVC